MEKLIIKTQDLQHNFDTFRACAKVPFIGVVKGNGYGLGLLLFAQFLCKNGASMLAVDHLKDAALLRQNEISTPILLLRPIMDIGEAELALQLDVVCLVGNAHSMQCLDTTAQGQQTAAKIHLFLDTGFGGYGFADLKQAIAMLLMCPHITVEGTATHLHSAMVKNQKTTIQQFEKFISMIKTLEENGVSCGIKHVCNSWAAMRHPSMHLDAVRVGSVFLGRMPGFGLKPVGEIQGDVLAIHDLQKGSKIGYAQTAKLAKKARLAVIGIGYSEGVGTQKRMDAFRFLDRLRYAKDAMWTKPLFVKIEGKCCPVVGRINMHHFLVKANLETEAGMRYTMPCQPLFVSFNIERSWFDESSEGEI